MKFYESLAKDSFLLLGWLRILCKSCYPYRHALLVAHCLHFVCLPRAGGTPRYYAVKILTVHANKGHHDDRLLELEVMQTITESTKTPLLPHLHEHFEKGQPHGRHLCLGPSCSR